MEDHFDRLPDCILLDILSLVSDSKSLVRCLSVSKRFHSLVPYATSLRLQVDRVIADNYSSSSSSMFSFFETLGRFLNLFFTLSFPPPSTYYSPSSVLRAFRCVRHLDLQLPSDDESKRPSGGAFVRYRATFGETLEKCVVIVGFRRKEEETGDVGQSTKAVDDEEEEVKERVLWVIRALVDACKRHDYATRELIREHPGLARLRMSDAAGEGVVEMDERGLDECRKCPVTREGCRVPRVKMQMWYGRKMEVCCDGEVLEGATLVMARTVKDRGMDMEVGDEAGEAFGGEGYKEAIGALMNRRSYSLEMNSFLI